MLSKHVTSLEISNELKSLNVPQRSEFYWVSEDGKDYDLVYSKGYDWSDYPCYAGYKYKVSAFLSSELSEGLPEKTSTWKAGDYFFCRYGLWDEELNHIESSETECNAKAKMRIYLIENNILDVKSL